MELYYYQALVVGIEENNTAHLDIDLGLDCSCSVPMTLERSDGWAASVAVGDKLLIRTLQVKREEALSYRAIVATTDAEKASFAKGLFTYKAKITRLSDADTALLDVDLGLRYRRRKVKGRAARINAFEVKGTEKEQGLKATEFMRQLIGDKPIFVKTIKDKTEKWGRYLIEFWIKNDDGVFINCNDLLVKEGWAKYQYKQTLADTPHDGN